MKLIIGGDFVCTENNKELFVSGDRDALFGKELAAVLAEADFRSFNLEIPLTDQASPIVKKGPNLIAGTKTVAGYKAAGADLLSLANNHIMDQGAQGLFTTIQTLRDNGIAFFGAGENLKQAAEPFILETDKGKIGYYTCAEHEFSIAKDNAPGANPFDPLETPDHIAALKAKCDHVIVLYHGGKEFYRYPSPYLQKCCRKLIDKGADLVVCQHSHCIGCEEKYGSGTIVYGQGNFLFAFKDTEEWQTELLIAIDDDFGISYIPLVKKDHAIRLASGEAAAQILNAFRKRSEEITEEGFIEKEYSKFAKSRLNSYLLALHGKDSSAFRAANKLSGGKLRESKLEKIYDKEQLAAIRNFIECEAHRELLLKGLMSDE